MFSHDQVQYITGSYFPDNLPVGNQAEPSMLVLPQVGQVELNPSTSVLHSTFLPLSFVMLLKQ